MLGSIAEGRPRILDGAGFPAADRPSAHAPLVKTSRILDSGNCFHALVDMVADCAIYILDADGIVVSWNAGAERIKGYSAAEIIGRHFSCFFIEEERSAERPAELLKITDQIGRYEEEGWRVRKDGSRFRAHALVHPIRDPDGRLAGFAKITRDLTERDRTVEALRRSEDRFRRVVEAAPNAMVMIDRNGRIEMINAQTERVFGYSRAELMSQPVELLVPERFRCHHPGLRKAFFDDPRPRPMRAGHDLYGLRKDGSEFPVEIGLSPIETDEGIMVLSAIVDVSARKREEGLVRASLKEKDILLGEIHHRVKNNLQIVDSLLGLKSGKINDGAIQEILRESRNRIKSMALIHQILYQSNDFARMDFSNFLGILVPTLASSYGADPERIMFVVNAIEVRLPLSVAIPCGLLVNELISNALKHAFPANRRGEIRIDLSVVSDGQVFLSVEDDGVGIPDDLDLDQTVTLGLQLVMLLTDQIGGEMVIRRSDPTRFALQLRIGVEDRQ